MRENHIETEILVVGSGPGGAVTALVLAEAGRDVVLAEEGHFSSIKETKAYSFDEMRTKYRNVGMTPALGKPKVVYLEPCCVGGASEINAGLYHYPLAETLENWRRDYGIHSFGEKELDPFFKENEKEISISRMPQGVGPASRRIELGASRMGWKTQEVSRCWKYEKKPEGTLQETRQSMTETLVPKAMSKGCRLLTGIKVKSLKLKGSAASSAEAYAFNEDGQKTKTTIHFRHVFICAGAIQSPLLLRRSHIKQHVGNSLRMHPAVRTVAVFKEPINDENEGVPVVQVEEFKPGLTLGGSYSSLPHLALWLAGQKDRDAKLLNWKNMAIFYALVTGEGKGIVRNVPFLDEAFVRLPVMKKDLLELGEGLYRLGKLLFAAGAREIYPPVEGYPVFKNEKDLEILRKGLPAGRSDITTIHLFCSCPMGENRRSCAVDSFGRLHGFDNIYVSDASILPGTPGVNPQALIMALARRNAVDFLNRCPGREP